MVQWKLPSSISVFVQRAGRAARAPGRTGLAVLLAEKSIYNADLTDLEKAAQNETGAAKGKGKKKSVRQSSEYPKATKEYAIAHGVRRGGFDEHYDTDPMPTDVPLDRDSIDEGLYSFVQSVTCRRKVLMQVFGNDIPR